MSHKCLNLNNDLMDYIERVSLRENSIQRELRAATQKLAEKNMQVSPIQGQFMGLMTKMLMAKNVLEIGTFTGYSTLAFALSLPVNGKVWALDVSKEWTDIGQSFWEKANVLDKINLIVGDAKKSLEKIITEKGPESFDLAFIDANKSDYDTYYEKSLTLLRRGGVILIDNVLWSGDVADPTVRDNDTKSLRVLNEKIMNDSRVDISMIPLSDGLSIVRKK